MPAEGNKRLISRIYELLNVRSYDALDEFFAEGYVHHSPMGELGLGTTQSAVAGFG